MMMNEICSSSFELFMREKVDSDVDVSGHCARILITFSVEDVVMRIWHSWFNGHFNSLLSFLDSLSLTTFAFVFLRHDHSELIAFFARNLSLSKHSWSQLNQFHSDSRSFAIRACLGICSSFSLAISTHSESGDLHFLHLATVNLLKSQIYLNQFWFSFLWAFVLLLIEKTSEASHASHVSRRSSVFDSFLSVLIIKLPLFGIQKSVVCILQPLELVRISSFVGMLLQRFLSECLFDLLRIGILANFKQLVKLSRIDFLLLISLSLLAFVLVLVLPLLLISMHSGEKH